MKAENVSTSISPALKQEVEAIAKEEHRSVASVFRLAIIAYVEAHSRREAA